MDIANFLIPMTGIVLGIAAPIIILGVILWYKLKRVESMQEFALKLAEKGQPVPPEIFSMGQSPYSDLRRGLVLIALGLALAIALSQIGAPWAFGLIPLFMGIGYLIVWVLEKNKR